MKRCRTVIKEVDEELHAQLQEEPSRCFDGLVEMAIPAWAISSFIGIDEEDTTIEMVFFESSQEFFVYYTRRVIDALRPLHCFRLDEVTKTWKQFIPPTIIGPDLQTTFRD